MVVAFVNLCSCFLEKAGDDVLVVCLVYFLISFFLWLVAWFVHGVFESGARHKVSGDRLKPLFDKKQQRTIDKLGPHTLYFAVF